MVSQQKRCSQWGSLCVSGLVLVLRAPAFGWSSSTRPHSIRFGGCRAEESISTELSFHKSLDSVFIISVFFEIDLTVAFLEFYLTEVRTKQPTFTADL